MSALDLLIRVLAVLVLLGVTLWLLRRVDGGRGRRSAPLQVLGSARLGKGASVTVVRIGGEDVVLGVTEHNVTLLGPATTEPAALDGASADEPARELVPAAPDAAPADFRSALAAELARTGASAGGPPPTARQFLRSAYRAARSRNEPQGAEPDEPAVSAPADTASPATTPAASSVPPAARAALRRAVVRQQARRAEADADAVAAA